MSVNVDEGGGGEGVLNGNGELGGSQEVAIRRDGSFASLI